MDHPGQKHPMLRLRRLTVRNFRSLKNVENLELDDFNVFIGANGSGKSNFLALFRMVSTIFSYGRGGLQHYVARSGGASTILSYGGEEDDSLGVELHFEGEGFELDYRFQLARGEGDILFYRSERVACWNRSEPDPPQVVVA